MNKTVFSRQPYTTDDSFSNFEYMDKFESAKSRKLCPPTKDRKLPTEDRKLPTKNRKLPTENRKLPTENRKLLIEDRKLPTEIYATAIAPSFIFSALSAMRSCSMKPPISPSITVGKL